MITTNKRAASRGPRNTRNTFEHRDPEDKTAGNAGNARNSGNSRDAGDARRAGRPGLVIGPDKARELDRGPSAGRPQHDDLGARVRYADDGVDEVALHRHPAFNLEAQPDEEGRHRVQVRDRDADMIEASDAWHDSSSPSIHPSDQARVYRLVWSSVRPLGIGYPQQHG